MADQTLEAFLAQLETERATLDVMIAGIRQRLGLAASGEANGGLSSLLAGMGAASAPASAPGTMRADEFFQMSIPEAIKKYLGIMKQPQQPKAIAEAIRTHGLLTNSKKFDATVQTALKRLSVAGEVTNVTGKGWGLSEWYKGRAGTVGPPKPSGKTKRKKKVARKKPAQAAKNTKKPSLTAHDGGAEAARETPRWNQFLAEQRKAGKTMQQAAEEWRQRKEQTS